MKNRFLTIIKWMILMSLLYIDLIAIRPTYANTGWQSMELGDVPVRNPMQGFVPFYNGSDRQQSIFPHSLEWHYFPLNEVLVAEDTYDWTSIEAVLDNVASRGNQTVFRFYVDYPEKNPLSHSISWTLV